MTTTTQATTKCFWITFENDAGERWDEGVPYVAQDEEDAERQMIVNGCGGDDANIDELRERYQTYFEGEAADYEINEAEDYEVDDSGLPRRKPEQD